MTRPTYYCPPNPGMLRISGQDRIVFLQRQTTNDLNRLVAGQAVSTVLTNPAARIIDVLQVFPEDENALAAITLAGRGPATAIFLKKRVFFMDKVSITDLSGQVFVLDVNGPGAAEAVQQAGIDVPAAGAALTVDFGGAALRTIGQPGPGGMGIRITGPAEAALACSAAIAAAGALELTHEEYDVRRVEAGLPGPQAELVEEYTPLETGLNGLVSDTKGCYTGQEVIARQISYDKVTRRMVGIALTGPVEAGSRVIADGTAAGAITSVVLSERFGPIALAVIKRPYFEPGTAVDVVSGVGTTAGLVSALPFSGSHPQRSL